MYNLFFAEPFWNFIREGRNYWNNNWDVFKTKLLAQDMPKNMLRYRCIGREYTDMALGKIHFGEYRVLKPWDHAAGLLILSESGGYHAYIGTQNPYRPIPTTREPVLVSTSELEWLKLRKLFT